MFMFLVTGCKRCVLSFPGRGVFTHESIEPSAFVVEYRGNIFTPKEAQIDCADALNNFMFDFSWDGKHWW